MVVVVGTISNAMNINKGHTIPAGRKIRFQVIVGFFILTGMFLLAISFSSFESRAADTGLKSPASTGEDYNQWSTPSGAFSSNDSYALESVQGEKQDYYDFTFSVPSGATIDGVEVQVEAKDLNCNVSCIIGVELSWDGGVTYTTAGYDTGELTSSDVVYTLGGSTDIWGRTWSDTNFSDANFRLRINADVLNGETPTIRLDHIQVKVYYTEAAATVASPPITIRGGLEIRGGVEFR